MTLVPDMSMGKLIKGSNFYTEIKEFYNTGLGLAIP